MKWEIFGKRYYVQELLAYLLLLMCMTLSATLSQNSSFTFQLHVWLYLGFCLLISSCRVQLFTIDKRLITMLVVVAVAVLEYSFVAMQLPLVSLWKCLFDGILFFLYALAFFIRIKVLEFLGEPVIRSCDYANVAECDCAIYSQDIWKKQSTSYLLVYGCLELYVPTFNELSQMANITLCFFLWILGIQYLEVNGTAGYLIPMIRGMVDEVYQLYHILCSISSVHFFTDLQQHFFILLGQFGLEPFESLKSKTSYVIGYILLASNCFIVIVLELNILVAMMTNSIDENKAKLNAKYLLVLHAA
ncbi:hypothetical protein THRCLA_01282 [Thraustotheca clavata]|uniref:Ion transport domain-containing protein n=1 Tax=Thraustotheca clavata TaxID=74557 RepID=A0A1W0A962_9STRA|nr:hypothetical protein THRCLA_01282 [Thraustotheca clavata]